MVTCSLSPNPPLCRKVVSRLALYGKTANSRKPQRGEVKMDLADLVASTCRRKIIEYLADNGSTNIMQLILGIRGKYPQTNTELLILQKEGIIIDQHIGRMRIIKLNKENPRTTHILQALKILTDKKADSPN